MSAEPSTSDGGITKICDDGDVILTVGPNKEKLQISSSFLKHISPVFKAILTGPMREGNALRNKPLGSPITIALPEDAPETMRTLLKILYGADYFHLEFLQLYEIMVLADKYDMTERLYHLGISWIHNLAYINEEDVGSQEYWDALIIAYMIWDRGNFHKLSKTLSSEEGSMIDMALASPDRELSLKLALAMEELR